MKKLKSFFQNQSVKRWSKVAGLTTLTLATLNVQGGGFLASIVDPPSYSFDGTVAPFEEMIDYTELSSAEKYLTYNQLKAAGDQHFIPHLLDMYNQENLTFNLDNVDWRDASQVAKMNLQYNMTVPYAGNYKLDSKGMHAGSHPGIDWPMPVGTPVRSVMVGEVVKTSMQSSGFGHHVVIETRNAPDPENPGKTTTLYSAYSHLSDIYVQVGDIVEKGEVFALSGNTGTSTAAHLDWQLINNKAPWQPYWPFTWTDVSNAGLNFWSAVNAGLGKDNVYKYTSDPAMYVLAHQNTSSVVAEEEPEPEVEVEPTPVDSEEIEEIIEEIIEEEVVEVAEEPEPEVEVETSVKVMDIAMIDVDMPSFIMADSQRTIKVTLYDVDGNVLSSPQFTDDIDVTLTSESAINLNRDFLNKNDFKGGVAELDLYGLAEGQSTIVFEIGGSTFTTTPVNVISEIANFAKFGVAHDGYFTPGRTEVVQLQAQDHSGNPTPQVRGNGEVTLKVIEGNALLSPSKVILDDIKNGVYEISVTPKSNDDIIIEATYKTKVTESTPLQVQDFTDLATSHEYYTAVNYLREKGTIGGYDDGSFKPSKDVSRVEALKMIFSGMDLPVTLGRTISFKDTSNGQWYSDYLATAADQGIVKGYPDGSFKPVQGVNRAEFLKMLFAAMDVNIDPVVTENPAADVDNLEWHAPYVQYAIEKNIFPGASANKNFYPAQAMSRVEVAEVIYRLIVSLHNDGAAYSIALSIPKL